MLELSTRTKWPLFTTAEVSLELSNGNSYNLLARYGKRLEFELVSSEAKVNFRYISKNWLKTDYEAFYYDEKSILKIHSGICDYIEIDKKQYRLTGIFKNYINALEFYCVPKPLLIGHEIKAIFPENFEIQGVILSSYIFVKNWLKKG